MNSRGTHPTESTVALSGGAGAAVWLRELAGHHTGSGVLALVDQALVSGASFLVFVVVGRVCGESALGTFNLAMTFVVLLAGTQQALIAVPYTIYSNQLRGHDRRVYAGSALAHLCVLIPIAIVVMALAAAASSVWLAPLELSGVLALVTAVVPFVMLREFVRRVAFAHMRMDVALAIDAATAVVQLAAIALLAWGDWLTPGTAYVALGAACALAAGGYLAAQFRDFEVRLPDVRVSIRRDWKLGRWVFLQQVATIAHMYLCPWVLALMVDRSSAGVFTACVSVVMLVNPFLQAMGNHFAPRFARAMADSGRAYVRRLFWQCWAVIGSTVLVLFMLLAAFGGRAVEVLYRGPAFAGLGVVVTVLAVRMLIFSARLAAHHGLLVEERADLSVLATFAGLITTFVASLLMIGSWGLLGAATAWTVGSAIETILHLIFFLRVNGQTARGQIETGGTS